jgi:type II secretory pathway component GspD/PulD (secretin)
MKRSRKFVVTLCVLSACGLLRAQSDPLQSPDSDKPAAQKLPSARVRAQAEKHYLEGARALEHEDLKTAAAEFDRAVDLDPGNEQYQASQEIVLQHEATGMIQAADKAKILNHPDEAHADLLQAFRLDPKNPMLAQHLDEITNDVAPDAVQLYPQDKTIAPPILFAPLPMRHSFHLHTNAEDLIRQVLTPYGVVPTFDSSVKNQMTRFDADNIDFAEARQMLNLVTNTFFVALDPRRALVAQDTKDKRAEFERMALETVYFPGLTPAEITEMVTIAKSVFDAQQVTTSPGSSTLTVRAPALKLAALNATLSEMLDGRSEVALDVRLYDIAKTRTVNVGLQLPQQTSVFNIPTELNSVLSANSSLVQEIISSGLASAGDYAAIAAILIASGQVSNSVLNQPFATFGNGLTYTGIAPGSVTGNLALNSSDSRVLDQMTMRLLDQEESTLKSGTRYPIITSTYSSLTGSSLSIPGLSTPGLSSTLASLGVSASSLSSSSNQTIPQVQYEDLGLTLKVKPYIQKDRDITLKLDLKIDSLAGASINNIPVLDNQQYTATITLKPGSSALVVSSLSKQQSSAVSGVPGLSELPGFQSTTNNNAENDVSNLIILVTPHIIRLAHRQDAGRMIVMPIHE